MIKWIRTSRLSIKNSARSPAPPPPPRPVARPPLPILGCGVGFSVHLRLKLILRDSAPENSPKVEIFEPFLCARMPNPAPSGCCTDRYSSQFENNYFTEVCSGSDAGSYLRLIDFVYHSTLGLRVIKRREGRWASMTYSFLDKIAKTRSESDRKCLRRYEAVCLSLGGERERGRARERGGVCVRV